jgi:hypothetical protein
LPFTLLSAFTIGAHADAIIYSEWAIVSGSIGNTNITNASIPLTASGSSSTVVESLPGIFTNVLPTELTIAGIGSTMITEFIQFVSNTTNDSAGVGDNSSKSLIGAGTGRPVVLIEDLGGTAHTFESFAADLKRSFHVYGITGEVTAHQAPQRPQ